MKALANLNSVEKAQFLHSLFPQEMPGLLQFIRSSAQTLIEEQEQCRANWQEQLFGFDFWLSLARQADKTIAKYGRKLEKSSRLFADQLFDGFNATFTINCLLTYITIRRHPNAKFSQAIDLLYGETSLSTSQNVQS